MKLKKIGLAVWTGLLLGVNLPMMAQVFTTQHNFTNTPDGANPRQLTLANGYFYGATASGGNNGYGSIFKFNPNGPAFTTVYDFTAATDNGQSPNNLLVTSNVIYGTTTYGGTNNLGMIFAVNTNGTGFTSLYSFAAEPDGHYPQAGLILNGATLYGTAQAGGTNGGTLFKINTNGTGYNILHWFTNTPDGSTPRSELILSGSTLYGTTAFGGTNGNGTIFSINTNGTGYTILCSFTNSPDPKYSYGGLVLDSGVLYGTTGGGGSNNTGTIFAINTNGSGFTILRHFTAIAGNSDGWQPKSTLTLSDGKLYGTTIVGGSGSGGTVFRVNTNGAGFSVIKSFSYNPGDGNDLENGVTLVGNTLWGTTFSGGTGGYGILFSLVLSPVITAQPESVTVTNGNPATFTVTATDASVTNYQWYFNTNTFLAGQTSNSLNFASTTTNNAGTYTVMVSDNFGAVTSSPALLTVLTAPVISVQPQSLTATNGNPATFSVTATGSGTLNYQWYFNTNTLLVGQTGNSLNFGSATTNNAGTYTVMVTNNIGAVTSSPAVLTVVVPVIAPTITQQPQNYTVTNGYSASFTNVASGTALYYRWYFNTNTFVIGGTNNILTIDSATTNQAGYYSVIVSNTAGSATSSPARLTVISTRPIILAQPQNQAVAYAGPATFIVTAAGQGPLKYQWFSNNVAVRAVTVANRLTGKTNATLTFTAAFTNVSYYFVIITNTLGWATSSLAQLTVITAPIITSNPQPVTVSSGDPARFTVGAIGASILRFQWYFNTNNVLTNLLGNALAGRTNGTLDFSAVSNSLAGRYSVMVTNTFGRATSSPALLSISSSPPPVITLQPLNAIITNGNPVSFTSAATGIGPLSYQWLFRTNLLIAGATNTTLIFTNANQPGVYSMKVTNSFGAATSSLALLTISNRPIMLSSVFDQTSGSYSFAFVDLAGSTNRLWATTNLAAANAWQTIATNVMATNALWFFTDTNTAKTNAIRLYRFSTP